MNSLFPISVLGATVIAVMLWQAACADGVTGFDATSLTFAATLLSLAILEHWFLVLPLPSEALWNWVLRERAATTPAKGLGAKPL
jgi:putative photosynthetic complex assembly protein 2